MITKEKALTAFHNITKMGDRLSPSKSSKCNDVAPHLLVLRTYKHFYFLSAVNYPILCNPVVLFRLVHQCLGSVHAIRYSFRYFNASQISVSYLVSFVALNCDFGRFYATAYKM
jgi:hypothetical protein